MRYGLAVKGKMHAHRTRALDRVGSPAEHNPCSNYEEKGGKAKG
jgi:hypothetical protein